MGMSASPATVAGIYRYPVKGLSPEPMLRVELDIGKTLPADRRYAIENGPSGFDPEHPRYLPKSHFLMLMRNERLAALRSHYDDASHVLTIRDDGKDVARGDLTTHTGRMAIERFFASSFSDELRGPPAILAAPDHSFSDVAAKVVSLINLASVADIEGIVGQPVDPLRFRGNLYIKGWPAWSEHELLDKEISVGKTRLKVVKTIVRCAAVNVDPEAGVRDMNIPRALMQAYGHDNCGIYARVIAGGSVAAGDTVAIEN